MASETCPYCGKSGVRRLALHLKYCARAPLEDVTKDDADARFEERAKAAEQEQDERVERAGKKRDFLPFPSNRNVRFPTIAWYLKPNGALPEDAFVASSSWSPGQRDDMAKRGFIEVTPCASRMMRREDGTAMGGVVFLDPPPKDRWERILQILEARRGPALQFAKERLEEEQAVSADGLTPAERRASLSRLRVYSARVEALSSPYPADKLYAFFEEEVRWSRRYLDAEASIRRMVDERVDELVGAEID